MAGLGAGLAGLWPVHADLDAGLSGLGPGRTDRGTGLSGFCRAWRRMRTGLTQRLSDQRPVGTGLGTGFGRTGRPGSRSDRVSRRPGRCRSRSTGLGAGSGRDLPSSSRLQTPNFVILTPGTTMDDRQTAPQQHQTSSNQPSST